MNTRKLLISVLMLVSVLFSACAPAATPIASTSILPTTAPVSTTVISPTIADAIVGTWSGTAKGGDFSFDITATIGRSCTIGSVCRQFDIPAIPCSGTWTLMGISGTTYQFQAGDFK